VSEPEQRCQASKALFDLKGQAPLMSLTCSLERAHEDKTHYDATYKVRWFS
jgi:hypothetical protein